MPRLVDDGTTVTLDLHGERVDAALRTARRALVAAARAGRRRLRIVHGTSTTATGARTIKTELHRWLDGGSADGLYVSAERGDTALTLHLDLTARVHPRRLAVRDVL
ncbi:MAG: Smr/MutS family protein [Rhodothermales bacterium]|nr:Smr/MutS family protein [Rhodothermales bacterium]